jgi:ferredoxin-NADP reductase
MMMFLRLADGDGKMTAREMERFDSLVGNRDWCRSSLLKRSLANTEAEKPTLWKQYVSGEFRSDVGRVAASLDTVLGAVAPADRADVEADLLYFCRELLKAARGGIGLPGRDPETRATFTTLLELIQRPSARAAQKVRADAWAEPKSAAPNTEALLIGEVGADTFWQRGKLQLRCAQVVDETHDVKTFRFVAEPPKLFRYYPGQFVTLEVPIDDTTVRRSYTISSSPSRPHLISITVKRVESGRISGWLHDNIRVDSTLFADGPHGKFTCIGDNGGPFLFISGGSGVTPVMSMSRWLCDTTPRADVHFLHFARTADDLIFEHELRLMARQVPGFHCDFVCSRVAAGGDWSGPVGRISAELLTATVPDLKRRSIYLCGPVPFMQATREILDQLGFGMARFRQESFGGVPRDLKSAEGAPTIDAKVTFATSNKVVDCTNADYILDLALANGVPATFSCRAGQCGTCRVALLEGSVEHDCTDGLSSDDIESGLILSCQARPTCPVVVDL